MRTQHLQLEIWEYNYNYHYTLEVIVTICLEIIRNLTIKILVEILVYFRSFFYHLLTLQSSEIIKIKPHTCGFVLALCSSLNLFFLSISSLFRSLTLSLTRYCFATQCSLTLSCTHLSQLKKKKALSHSRALNGASWRRRRGR